MDKSSNTRPFVPHGTFYFFPVFLPLAEVASWLIALMGMAAGVAGFSLPVFWRKYRVRILAGAALCFALAGGITLYSMPDRALRSDGTQAVAKADYPEIKTTGNTPQAPAAGSAPAFTLAWTVNVPEQILSTPVVSGNMLVYGTLGQGTKSHSIEAVSLKDGTKIWSIAQKEPVFTMNKGPGDTVFAGEGLHHSKSVAMTAVDVKEKRILWAREFLGHIEENAAFDSAHYTMWTGTGPGGLWSLDMRDGNVRWNKKLGHIDAKPLVYAGVIYVPAQVDEEKHETTFYSIDAVTGFERWQLALEGQPWGSPLANRDGTVILSTTGRGQIGVTKDTDMGRAQGISPQGKLLWNVELPGMALQPSHYIASRDMVIHATKSGYLVALNARDGTKIWQAKTGAELQAATTLVDSGRVPLLAAVSHEGFLSVRNALNGRELARWAVAKHATASPVVYGDYLYVFGARSISAFGGLGALGRTP